MNIWYSPRGARRGLLFAALLAALWGCWTAGYAQAALHLRAAPTVALEQAVPGAAGDACRFTNR